MTEKRVVVCVSGRGSNLRALIADERRKALGGRVVLVVADRDCLALDVAREAGLDVKVIRPGDVADRTAWDRALCDVLMGAAPDIVVLAGFMRIIGPETLDAFAGRILNVHPALLPAFPGVDAVGDALAAGVKVTGVTVHLVDATLDGGPIVLQEAVPVVPGDDRDQLAERLHAVEHRLLPHAVSLALAGALEVRDREVTIAPGAVASMRPVRRALISVSDKRGLAELGAGLAELGFELVSTGGTARSLREAGLTVTDVSAVTGFPEMLDGRVKTLHPRIAGGVLGDLRRNEHRAQLAAAAIEPFELVVVNLYRFAEAAARPGVTDDELIEEIDIGGPTLVRAAAKNHANVGIVTDPDDYTAVVAELGSEGTLSADSRAALARKAFRLTASYDATIAGELARRAADAETALLPATLDLRLERAGELRYGENPHQAAALYLRPGEAPETGPFAAGIRPLQGKALSYNNLLDAANAVALARDLRGAAVVIVKHGNPCGAAEAEDLATAWERALAGDPVSAFGGVVGIHGSVDATLARLLVAIFLEVVVASAFESSALEILGAKPAVRLLEYPAIMLPAASSLELRSAGGAILATESDVTPDDPAGWRVATQRAPTADELRDLDLGWRVCRRVASNAIVLAREGSIVGVGAGQMSRVDSARLAVAKAGERARGAVCASDAFYPFADGVEVCGAAGVTAFVQPGGSQRDAEVIAAADAAGAAMVLTGVRHFRH